ncbi:MAG: glycine--tRNA ligase subunit beta [Aquificae bacterium]|nr:glycine--tRNA ligase subunit beta [Aquificota bacterium]
MNRYLLEIGCEELPSQSINIGREYLQQSFHKSFENFFMYDTPQNINIFATPRRLSVLLENLKEKEDSKEELIIGPPYKVAVDNEGRFTKAAIGFAKKNNIPIENLQKIETEKGVYIGAVIKKEGKPLQEHIKQAVPSIISNIPFPKTMRWNRTNFRFSRPIRWIVSLLNEDIIDIEIAGIKSSRYTYLHRFMTKPIGRGEKKEIATPTRYEEILKLGFIVPRYEDRKKAVETQVIGFANSIDASPILDEELLDEVTNLLEFPVGILGDFSPEYLILPKEVIIVVCKHHQRFFNFEKDGKLIPKFLAFSNTAVKDKNVVKAGYEKVLKARLEDALFFYEEDLKKNLEDLYPKLKGILFHEKLGTMLDKVKRNGIIAQIIAKTLKMKQKSDINRANKLSKTDLLTEMVKEFDELQGIMGMYYALKQGEKEEVAKAIYEHYLPKTAEDPLPKTKIGTILAVADKLDTLTAFFSIGEKPKAGADPFGLRRLALGIVRILVENKLDINLEKILEQTIEQVKLPNIDKTLKDQVLDFINARFVFYLKNKGIDTDIINSVLSTKEPNLYRAYLKIQAVSDLKHNPEFEDIMITFKRIGNIIPSDFKENFDKKYLTKKEEKNLYQKLLKTEKEVLKLLEEKEYKKALEKLLELKPHVDRFFDNVMVMVKENRIKTNRLSLLKRINDLFKKLSDFTKINVQGGK